MHVGSGQEFEPTSTWWLKILQTEAGTVSDLPTFRWFSSATSLIATYIPGLMCADNAYVMTAQSAGMLLCLTRRHDNFARTPLWLACDSGTITKHEALLFILTMDAVQVLYARRGAATCEMQTYRTTDHCVVPAGSVLRWRARPGHVPTVHRFSVSDCQSREQQLRAQPRTRKLSSSED